MGSLAQCGSWVIGAEKPALASRLLCAAKFLSTWEFSRPCTLRRSLLLLQFSKPCEFDIDEPDCRACCLCSHPTADANWPGRTKLGKSAKLTRGRIQGISLCMVCMLQHPAL